MCRLLSFWHLDIAELGQRRRQIHSMSVQRGGFEAVFGSQPVRARFANRGLGRMHERALGDLATNRVQSCPSFFLCRVPLAQLLALPGDDADVDRQLIADNRAATLTLGEFNPPDLRWQLATFSHRRGMRTRRPTAPGSRRRLGVRCDEPLNLRGRYPARGANLDPCKLASRRPRRTSSPAARRMP